MPGTDAGAAALLFAAGTEGSSVDHLAHDAVIGVAGADLARRLEGWGGLYAAVAVAVDAGALGCSAA
jgi:hypothetical protein